MFTNTILNFTLGSQIGSGGQANVFNAIDHQLNANIVIKKIPKSNFTDINRFFEESRKLYLSRHHNVVDIMYGCQDMTYVYLAMPLYRNGSLKSIIDTRYLTEREIIRYSLQFLSGLNNIHSKGLLHYDIKPENILIDDSNKALISDFGLAEYMGAYGFANLSGTTEELAPPEFFNQPIHNLKFDIYQAGLTLYRICNGDLIFLDQLSKSFVSRGISNPTNFINKVQRGNFPDRSFFLPHISEPLRRIIRKALKPDPSERYNSVIEILNSLSKIENSNDWHYSIVTDLETWQKTNYSVTCELNKAHNNYEVIALKNGRRVTRFCRTFTSLNDTRSLLYNCLNSNW